MIFVARSTLKTQIWDCDTTCRKTAKLKNEKNRFYIRRRYFYAQINIKRFSLTKLVYKT